LKYGTLKEAIEMMMDRKSGSECERTAKHELFICGLLGEGRLFGFLTAIKVNCM